MMGVENTLQKIFITNHPKLSSNQCGQENSTVVTKVIVPVWPGIETSTHFQCKKSKGENWGGKCPYRNNGGFKVLS